MSRTFKEINVGGTSDAGDIPHIVEMMKLFNPKTVVDVGTGCFGRNGYLLRQYVEHKYRKLYGVDYMNIIGIEAYQPNADYVATLGIYNEIEVRQAIEFFEIWNEDDYDLITCTHVLEHHYKESGWRLLELMRGSAKKGIILACPLGEYAHTDVNNQFQNHLSSWTPDEIAEKYPITTPIITRNNVGKEEFLIGIPA